MSKWSDFYRGRMTESYRLKFGKKYSLFLELVDSQIKTNVSRVEEHGCGIGTVTKLLVDGKRPTGPTHLLFDNDADILNLATVNFYHPRASLMLQDITKPINWGVDLIHSHGVLEHFCDEDIRLIIDNQKARCKTLIHYVPSDKYESASFGDERLLNPGQWEEICNPHNIISFNDGKDLILAWGLT